MFRLNLKKLCLPFFLAVLVLVAFSAAPAFGQGYDITYDSAGGRPGTANTLSWSSTTGYTLWHSRNRLNNEWSTGVSIDAVAPGFEFKFYGQTVTDFKVSDNGVMTFDTTAVGLPGDNGPLPDAGLPSNSVLFLWDAWNPDMLSTGTLYYRSFGTAPDRQIWVKHYYWSLGNHRYSWYSFILEETTNQMYTIVDYMHSSYGTLSATVGAQQSGAAFEEFTATANPIYSTTSTTTNPLYTFRPLVANFRLTEAGSDAGGAGIAGGEITNGGESPGDLSGFQIAVYNSSHTPVETVTVGAMPVGIDGVATFGASGAATDIVGANAWGWSGGTPAGLVLYNSDGELLDAVFFNLCDYTKITSPAVVPLDCWIGNQLGPWSTSTTWQRQGDLDTNQAADWFEATSSMGAMNPGLVTPFDDTTFVLPGGGSSEAMVRITEVVTDGDGGTNEFIEFTNMTSNVIDMRGFELNIFDDSELPQFGGRMFIVGAVLDEGDTYVLVDGTTLVGPADEAVGWDFEWAANGGVVLRDAERKFVDSVFFGEIDPSIVTVPQASGWIDQTLGTAIAGNAWQRRGDADHDDDRDWIRYGSDSLGEVNEGIHLPWSGGGGGGLVISEVAVDIARAGVWEFFELGNPGGGDLDIRGWSLSHWDNTNTNPAQTKNIIGKVMPGGTTYIFGESAGFPALLPDELFLNVLWTTGGGIMMRDLDGAIVDVVFWGNSNPSGVTNPVPIGDEWTGPNMSNLVADNSHERLGGDTNTAADWTQTPSDTFGSLPPGLSGGGSGGDEPFFLSITATDFAIVKAPGGFAAQLDLFDSLEIFVAIDDPNPWNTLSFEAEDTGEVGVTLTPAEMGFDQPFVLVPGTPPAPDRFIYTNPMQRGPILLTTFSGEAQVLGTTEITFTANDGNGNYVSTTLTLETLSGPKILPPRAPVAQISGSVIDGFEAILEVGDPIDIEFTVVDPNATDEVTVELEKVGGTLNDTQSGLTITLPQTFGPSPTPMNVFLPGETTYVPGDLIIGISADDGNGNVTETTLTIIVRSTPRLLTPVTEKLRVTGVEPVYRATGLVGADLGVTFTAIDAGALDTITFSIDQIAGTIGAPSLGFDQLMPIADENPGITPHSISLTGKAVQAGRVILIIKVWDNNPDSSQGVTAVAYEVIIQNPPVPVDDGGCVASADTVNAGSLAGLALLLLPLLALGGWTRRRA